MADDTGNTAAQEGGNMLGDFIGQAGGVAAQGALDTVSPAVPELGASFAQGALDQVTASVGPYLPYLAIGFVAVLLLLGRR